MASVRTSIKLHSKDRKQQWRDKFKSHCIERMKLARQEEMDQRRYDSWMNVTMAQEWQQFRKENEIELNEAGVDLYDELDTMIDLQDVTQETDRKLYEEYERLQQEELDTAIETYESISIFPTLCMKCQQCTFFQQGHIHQCATCGFTIGKELMDALNLTIQNHHNVCSSQLEFTVEPGVNGSIIGVCSVCDIWMLI